MKKLLAGVLVLMMLFSIVGCTPEPAVEEPTSEVEPGEEVEMDEIVIGVSMPTLQEERWKKDEAMIKKELMALGVKEEYRNMGIATNMIKQQLSALYEKYILLD
jgi:ABC-type xylose transport system substrate-binding protein